MTPGFEKLLLKVESAWLIELFNKNKELFVANPLPSHDHTHHLRVWLHARKLLNELFGVRFKFTDDDIVKLIIAVFFHDTGLTKTYKSTHGDESRKICEQFLSQKEGISEKDRLEIQEAIEKHDDKTYISGRDKIDLFSLLSVSDDLDAYGAIGIYRYFEIYKLRGISEALIPSRVVENINKRFAFLEKNFGHLKDFIQKQKARKNYTRQFFRQFTVNDAGKRNLALQSFKTLNLLMQNAFQYKNGLGFLLKEDPGIYAGDEISQNLVHEIKKELTDVKNELNLIRINY
ncbi:MAG: HD domain-containing protein [Bacteroidales bacterium]|nr:HD domain-containing protein [Bacteroidales bacterium]